MLSLTLRASVTPSLVPWWCNYATALGVTMSARPGLLRCARPGTHRATGLGVP
jgi:hypothetical protein